MGIGPITNILPLLASSIQPAFDVPATPRVENSARTSDETYSPSKGKSAGGSEDDGAEDAFADLEDEESEIEMEHGIPAAERDSNGQVNFFA